MTDKSIHTQAQELKDKLETEPLAASRELIEFCKRFAATTSLKREALFLKLEYTNADSEAEREQALTEMRVLVNNIVKDYLARPEADRIESMKYESRKREALQEKVKQKLPPTTEVVFRGENLGKQFGKKGFRMAEVNLELKVGEITGVVGENGNGKTTLFRICVGELHADTGQLSFPVLEAEAKKKPDWYAIKSQIAYIPQELRKWHGSIRDNLHYEAALHGLTREENERAVSYIIHRMGLANYADRTWSALSGGYKLRFSLARALVWKPRLLVIDEPLANLDVKAQSVVLNDLKNLAQSLKHPMAIMISSQHLHEIESVADQILFLREGSPVYYGPAADIGKERLENSYELACELSLQDLKDSLKGMAYNSVDYNGLVFVVHTPLAISQKDLLNHLLQNEVEIDYFRNISHSTKKLFV